MKIFMAQPWNNLGSQKEPEESVQCQDQRPGKARSLKAMGPALDLGKRSGFSSCRLAV